MDYGKREVLHKEKELSRARDALAAERRRMPWMAVDKEYWFDGPAGRVSFADLFEGRRQLIVYRAFYGPEVTTYAEGGSYPERACVGCSLGADQVAHPGHLHARNTSLAWASRRAPGRHPQLEDAPRMEHIPWYTIIDDFDKDFDVDEWHGTNAFIREDEQDLPHLLHQRSRRRADGWDLELPRHHGAWSSGRVGGFARGVPADCAIPMVELPRRVQDLIHRTAAVRCRTRDG